MKNSGNSVGLGNSSRVNKKEKYHHTLCSEMTDRRSYNERVKTNYLQTVSDWTARTEVEGIMLSNYSEKITINLESYIQPSYFWEKSSFK